MTFKIIIALAVKFSWNIYHVNVVIAFLNSELKESIYISLLEGLYLIRESIPYRSVS